MKTTEKMVKTCATPEQKISTSKVKTLATGLLFALAGLLGSGEAIAQMSDSLATAPIDSLPMPEVKTPKWWSFGMDPTYSPTDKVVVTRLSWWGSVHGVGVGGFLDLTGTPDVNSAFGKFTVSKWITKWVSVGVEYTLNSATPDKVRSWVICKHKLANGKVVYKLYPVSDKWFEPFVLVGVDQKLWEKAFVSAFWWTDIKGKWYYGEAEITHKVTKQIDALFQIRGGGTYTTKPKAWVYVWARVKIK